MTVWTFSVVVSSVTVLVAVIVGPLIQLHVAKRQIRSTTVSSNRQAWINNLRDNLATIQAYSSDVRELRAAHMHDPALTAKIQERARQAKILAMVLTHLRIVVTPPRLCPAMCTLYRGKRWRILLPWRRSSNRS